VFISCLHMMARCRHWHCAASSTQNGQVHSLPGGWLGIRAAVHKLFGGSGVIGRTA